MSNRYSFRGSVPYAATVKAWPLRGRESELGDVRALLRGSAGGVALCGPPGVGKSRLAWEAVRVARSRPFCVITLVATRAAATIPFGVLASAVDLGAARQQGSLDTLLAVRRSLLDQRKGRRLLLHVDDAHLLDEPSAAVVHQLVSERRATLVMTVRHGEPTPDAVSALWKDGFVERLDVQPLDPAATRELLESALHVTVDPASSARLHAVSGGNPLYLRELVRGALDSGTLRESEGVWTLVDDLPPSRRLIEMISERLQLAVPTDRTLLTALALAEPLGVDLLTALPGGAAALRDGLLRAERSGLVVTDLNGHRIEARLAHPLYGEVLRATMPLLELTELRERLAKLLRSTGAQRAGDVLRIATLQLDAGAPLDPAVALSAARQAREAFALGLAERLARVALGGARPGTGVVLADILFHQGRHAEAEELHVRLGAEAGGERNATRLALTRAFNLFWGLGDAHSAWQVLSSWAPRTSTTLQQELTAERAVHALFAGNPGEALALVEPLLHSEATSDRALARAAVAASPALVMVGRSLDGATTAAQGLRAVGRLPHGMTATVFGIMLEVCRAHALTAAGLLEEAETSARCAHDAACSSSSALMQGLTAWACGRVSLARGAVTTALGHFRGGAAIDAARMLHVHQRWNLIGSALAAAQAGDAAAAGALLRRIDQLPPGSDRFQAGELLRARAWTAAAAGDEVGARRELRLAVKEAVRAGHADAHVVTLHDLARLGAADEASHGLTSLAGKVQGDLVRAMAAHACALAEDDRRSLADAAERFAELGAWLLAAEAATACAHSCRRVDDVAGARSWQRRARASAGRCERARTPALLQGATAAELTGRQQEVARLAAAGLTSKEIAGRLSVSVRTVDNHLLRAYGTLGITSRAELATALGADARPLRRRRTSGAPIDHGPVVR
jgi:DNA-binding CsgD family transcriptional regulator